MKHAFDLPERYAGDEKFVREWSKMLRGEVYDAAYTLFVELLTETRRAIRRYNDADPGDTAALKAMLRELLGSCGENIVINQPFRCDYGCNIHIGENFMANFNLTVLDEALVTIGSNVFIGPNCGIYTACHPLDPQERNKGVEWAEPITIGDNVWIGGGTTILPGVTIGDNCTIGAGSVVKRDIPANSMAVGVPCRVIRSI